MTAVDSYFNNSFVSFMVIMFLNKVKFYFHNLLIENGSG